MLAEPRQMADRNLEGRGNFEWLKLYRVQICGWVQSLLLLRKTVTFYQLSKVRMSKNIDFKLGVIKAYTFDLKFHVAISHRYVYSSDARHFLTT